MSGYFSYWFPLIAILAGIEVGLGVLGVLWMNTANLSRVRTGSVFVLVASIIAFPTMFGFMISPDADWEYPWSDLAVTDQMRWIAES